MPRCRLIDLLQVGDKVEILEVRDKPHEKLRPNKRAFE
jgi:hypothetical protein